MFSQNYNYWMVNIVESTEHTRFFNDQAPNQFNNEVIFSKRGKDLTISAPKIAMLTEFQGVTVPE